MSFNFIRTLLLGMVALLAASAWAGEGGVPVPHPEIANPGKCIDDTEYMRRHHMDMLQHQRDLTLRQGVRGAKVQLEQCISCHASKTNGSVLGTNQNFCQACHAYAAVKLDCFECHQATPSKFKGDVIPKVAATKAGDQPAKEGAQ